MNRHLLRAAGAMEGKGDEMRAILACRFSGWISRVIAALGLSFGLAACGGGGGGGSGGVDYSERATAAAQDAKDYAQAQSVDAPVPVTADSETLAVYEYNSARSLGEWALPPERSPDVIGLVVAPTVPSSGSANYAGDAWGYLDENTGDDDDHPVYFLHGDSAFAVNFGAGQVDTDIAVTAYYGTFVDEEGRLEIVPEHSMGILGISLTAAINGGAIEWSGSDLDIFTARDSALNYVFDSLKSDADSVRYVQAGDDFSAALSGNFYGDGDDPVGILAGEFVAEWAIGSQERKIEIGVSATRQQ